MKEQEADDSDQDEDEVNGNDEEDSEFGDGEEGRYNFLFVIYSMHNCQTWFTWQLFWWYSIFSFEIQLKTGSNLTGQLFRGC